MGVKFQTLSSLKVHIRLTPPPQIMHTPREVSTKVVQRIVKFQILDFCIFLSSLTWNHIRE